MKKIFAVVFALLIGALATMPALAFENEELYNVPELKGTTLNVFNWGEYISDTDEDGLIDVNKAFEELTGIDVNYVTYASNEDLYAKLKSGGTTYDIIIPSDYMIARLKEEGLLSKVDFSNIPNYKYIADEYKGQYYDKDNEYSAAYSVGMVGLIYNTKQVKEAPESWSALWDADYAGKLLMFDNYRDAFAIAQQLLGYSINTTDKTELEAAAQKLAEQKPVLQSYVMDEIFNKMETGEAAMAPYYVGDFVCMKEVNPDLDFVYPKEGVNIFVDAVCIPSCAKNLKAAELYMNFLLDPEVALSNALSIGYATPNTGVLESEGYKEMAENKYLYPEVMPKTEYFFNMPVETLELMSGLWNDVKKDSNGNTALYAGIGAAVGVVVVVLALTASKKKKRERYE